MKKIHTKAVCIMLSLISVWLFTLQGLSAEAFNKSTANTIASGLTPDTLKAKAYASVHFATGDVVFESENSTEHYSVGNLIKLMTLYLTFEAIADGRTSLDASVGVSKNAQKASEGRERVFLDAGKKEKITVEDAIIAVCVGSACDAAYALAEHVSKGSESDFVEMMNAKSKELGMENTNYVDSTGNAIIDDGQYTCARDLAILSYHLVNNYPTVLDYTVIMSGMFEHTSTGEPSTQMLSSNALISSGMMPECDGLLVGYSKADKYAQASTADISGERVAAVVIGEETAELRAGELKYLMTYTASNFEVSEVQPAGVYVRKISVKDGKSLKTVTGGEFSYLQNLSEDCTIENKIIINDEIYAPVSKGDVVGSVVFQKVTEDDEGNKITEDLGTVDLVADEDIEKASWLVRLIRKLLTWLGIGDY